MIININDDFNLYKIAYSGQCFRAKNIGNDTYRFITREHVVDIRCRDDASSSYEISCDASEWNSIWHDYFDLDTNYSLIRSSIPISDKYAKEASNIGAGIRILKQDPFETMISFIISQRKSIPAIKKSVEKICSKWGKRIICPDQSVMFSFPTHSELKDLTADDLVDCGLGYRIPYVLDAIHMISDGLLNLESISLLSDDELITTLKSVYGIGDKVANCISLFSYHRTNRAPIDTWIRKVIDNNYNGTNPFTEYEGTAGIIQQYIFYAAQHEHLR